MPCVTEAETKKAPQTQQRIPKALISAVREGENWKEITQMYIWHFFSVSLIAWLPGVNCGVGISGREGNPPQAARTCGSHWNHQKDRWERPDWGKLVSQRTDPICMEIQLVSPLGTPECSSMAAQMAQTQRRKACLCIAQFKLCCAGGCLLSGFQKLTLYFMELSFGPF